MEQSIYRAKARSATNSPLRKHSGQGVRAGFRSRNFSAVRTGPGSTGRGYRIVPRRWKTGQSSGIGKTISWSGLKIPAL